MTNKTTQPKTIGEMIESEVRKKGMPINDFADRIHCTRANVYGIFKRNNINLLQLKQISTVLGRNFFADLAADLDMIDTHEESTAEVKERKLVSSFFEVVPQALKEIGKPAALFLPPFNGTEDEDAFFPDYLLLGFYIGFTVGCSLRERMKGNFQLAFNVLTDEGGNTVEVSTNMGTGTRFINILVTEKSRDEWRDTLRFAFDVYGKLYPDYNPEKGVHLR